MRTKGKNNKVLEGKALFDRAGFEHFGDKFNRDMLLFVDLIEYGVEMETGETKTWAEKQVRDKAPGWQNWEHWPAQWWTNYIFPRLKSELRNALITRNGKFFRGLADTIEAWKHPVDPLRAWICGTLAVRGKLRNGGMRDGQLHTDKTSAELHAMFRGSEFGYKVSPEVFTKTLREMGVRWRKHLGGRPPKKLRLKHSS